MVKALKNILYKGKIFDLIVEKVKLPNNKIVNFEYVNHKGSTGIIPLTDEDKIIFLSQYRHAIKRYIYEIPAGRLEKYEDAKEAATRELIEEIGYKPQKIEKLGEIFLAPGYSTEKIHIFLATNLVKQKQALEPDEIISLKEVKIKKALQMIKQGRIIDAKTIAGLLLLLYKKPKFASYLFSK